jgi:hypothetical protein
LEKRVLISTLKTKICWIFSFQKLTQFSQRNNALEAPASNIDGFLCIDTCVSSIQLNRHIWGKQSILPPETPKLWEVSFQKLIQFSKGNNVLDAAASNTDGVLPRDTCISSNYLSRTL